MSWNNVLPAWMFLQEFHSAVEDYNASRITHKEVYERIKDLDYVPDIVKSNWKEEEE